MAQTTRLIAELKRRLRARGMTYARIAAALGLSESSIKRMFSRGHFTLERLEQICGLIELEISDLIELMQAEREYLTELTPAQEDTLLADPRRLLMTYLLLNGWTLEQICEHYLIEPGEAERILIELHRARMVELLPFNRVRLLTARNFTWRKDGPVQRFFAEHVQREFLDSNFAGPGEHLRFVGGMLSRSGLTQMRQSIDRLAREFDELSAHDASLPLGERHGCSVVLAVRPWELSAFAKLRRQRGPQSAGRNNPVLS